MIGLYLIAMIVLHHTGYVDLPIWLYIVFILIICSCGSDGFVIYRRERK